MLKKFTPFTKEKIKEIFKDLLMMNHNYKSLFELNGWEIVDEFIVEAGYDPETVPIDAEKECELKAVEYLINEICTDEVVDYLNENMGYVPMVRDSKSGELNNVFQSAIAAYDYLLEDDGESIDDVVPVVGGMRSVPVGWELLSCCLGDVIDYYMYSVSYLLEDGTFKTMKEYQYGYAKEEWYIVRTPAGADDTLLNEGSGDIILNGISEMFPEELREFFDE